MVRSTEGAAPAALLFAQGKADRLLPDACPAKHWPLKIALARTDEHSWQ
jgi:hypothetical protein